MGRGADVMKRGDVDDLRLETGDIEVFLVNSDVLLWLVWLGCLRSLMALYHEGLIFTGGDSTGRTFLHIT